VIRNTLTAFSLVLIAVAAYAQPPSLNNPLPELNIANKGELLLENEEYRYRPWTSRSNRGEVQVLQYIAATMGGKKLFKPFTDMLKAEFPNGILNVTTVINLDDAMWGTGGLVISELKSNKKKYPKSTIVLDEDGAGKKAWQLGRNGAVLAVIDKSGSVIYLTQKALSEQELASTLALVKEQMGS
jgi:YtfJ family uncharacterized protein